MPILCKNFENAFNNISFYKDYPILKPFVGKNYGQKLPKVLLLAESHYLPKTNSGLHLNPQKWYEGNDTYLQDVEKSWLNTRNILNKEYLAASKGHAIYRNIHNALKEYDKNLDDKNNFINLSFMNTFLRPAEFSGKSIKIDPIDIEKSVAVINQVIQILEPEKIIFLSSKSYNAVANKLDRKPLYKVPHPACAWWNRVSRKGTGKEQFFKALSQ